MLAYQVKKELDAKDIELLKNNNLLIMLLCDIDEILNKKIQKYYSVDTDFVQKELKNLKKHF